VRTLAIALLAVLALASGPARAPAWANDDDPDAQIARKLLLLDKPAPQRLPMGYQLQLLKRHRSSVKGDRTGWTLHLFAHLHAGAGRLDRARIEIYAPDAKADDTPLLLHPLDLLQHEVRMARTIRLRRDSTLRRGQSYRIVLMIPGPKPERLADAVVTLK
jgi:hypothetical protein